MPAPNSIYSCHNPKGAIATIDYILSTKKFEEPPF